MAKINHNYGKLVDSKLVYAPNMLRGTIQDEEGHDIEVNIINPTDYYYRLNGYKNIVSEPYPQDSHTYVERITEDEQTIYKGWQQIIAPPEPPTLDERVDALEDAFLEFIMGD